MKFTDYLEVDILEEIAKCEMPKELHTFAKTKVNCDGFSGLSVHSCPGRSNICQSRCYDAKSVKVLVGGITNVKRALWYTYLSLYDPERLQQQLIKEVYFCTPVIRVHIGGDFVSPEHVKVWQEVAACFPRIRFFAFTRSYRIPTINKELLVLKEMSNFTVLASVDAETGLPPEEEGWRIAQMTHWNLEVPRTIQCPETVTENKRVFSCQQCKLCFGSKKVKVSLYFPLHGSGRVPDPSLIIDKNNSLYRR